MFGYVRPLVGELKVSEFERFKSAYCGLCYALGRRHGFFSRFLLNYDLTFLAAVLEGGAPPKTAMRRCPANPLVKKCALCAGDGLLRAADVTVILAWWKFDDEVRDSGFWRGLPARFLRFFFRRALRKASSALPEFAGAVSEAMERLAALEAAETDSVDMPADTFAGILAAAAGPEGGGAGGERRALQSLFYHVGRFIYIVDACDDYPEDVRTGSYNPLKLRYALTESQIPEAVKKELAVTLSHSLHAAGTAADLVNFSPEWRPVIENILSYGLPAVSRAVFEGTWKKRRQETPAEPQ
ncbi:DUF5685 family protein [Oscillospiraceae bacterium OttesenSCG-928-F05]|nr:DUF5685 family protein [Oscillospiraceae bacterium OttesenSCG-928-F05]